MERLPDRPMDDMDGVLINEEDDKGMSRSKKRKSKVGIYGVLLVVCLALFFLTAEEPVPLDQITVEKIDVIQNEKADGIFVVGHVADEAGRVSKTPYTFDEETGVAEVYIRQYQMTSVFGTKEYAAYIQEDPDTVKEIWLVYDDWKGDVEKQKLEYEGADGGSGADD